ncbi:phosphoribosylamine--glycine ligase [Pikeienuella piscinae]|uniref:Phosphoribosylamine--glycine ligase n=1 Tax=Pikeienuella piscinae TaxID=2748098 RepID=A0A7L5C0T5_9RHOB|nr:phosphoribosylamine--glycine ligase [Pikeienuella piscinae]QIE55449.1 phosphoribosylamine--glycine ligase [Pikeienuella piscinae]
MDILILGGGGREHALAWAIRKSPECGRLIVAPGNAGASRIAECAPLDNEDGAAVVAFAKREAVNFVVIGPEAPLAAGVADALRNAGIAVFGPSRAAAQLEASKGFTKEICAAVGAPTADYARFDDLERAKAHVRATGAPIVVKADGLAAGKGVTVAATVAQAESALEDIFAGAFGAAGAEVVIEEMLTGEEASFFVLSDGETALPFGSAQDHKRAFDGDEGPNTGGMGAYSPAPVMTAAVEARAMDEIVRPCLAEMARRGAPFQGVLFAGLMIENGRPKLIEFNTRFGDPECQVLAMRLGSDLLPLLRAAADGRLDDLRTEWRPEPALSVVVAAKGYPGGYTKGEPISGLEAAASDPNVEIFHAGTASKDGATVSNGGRVLAVTARGETLEAARSRAYAAVGRIEWPGGFHRRDIGWRALKPRE